MYYNENKSRGGLGGKGGCVPCEYRGLHYTYLCLKLILKETQMLHILESQYYNRNSKEFFP